MMTVSLLCLFANQNNYSHYQKIEFRLDGFVFVWIEEVSCLRLIKGKKQQLLNRNTRRNQANTKTMIEIEKNMKRMKEIEKLKQKRRKQWFSFDSCKAQSLLLTNKYFFLSLFLFFLSFLILSFFFFSFFFFFHFSFLLSLTEICAHACKGSNSEIFSFYLYNSVIAFNQSAKHFILFF